MAGYPDSKMWHSGSWMPNTVHGITLYIFKWLLGLAAGLSTFGGLEFYCSRAKVGWGGFRDLGFSVSASGFSAWDSKVIGLRVWSKPYL